LHFEDKFGILDRKVLRSILRYQEIYAKNVRVHNLKGVDIVIEKGKLIAFTGVSGSGKSSLAFDTLYVEGQRRYIESLPIHARRHLGSFPRPEVDSIEGLSPTVAIEQKTVGKNPRSTVGTLTGIYDFLRILFAKIASPYCPVSGEPVSPRSIDQIVQEICAYPEGTKLIIVSPYAIEKKGEFKEDFTELLRKGFTRIRLNGTVVDLSEKITLDGSISHDIDLVIDRLVLSKENRPRLIESITLALEYGKGLCKIVEGDREKLFSQHAYSPLSGLSYPPLEAQDFSFNHPQGYCPTCQGLGTSQEFLISKIIDPHKSLSEDCCIVASSFHTLRYKSIYTQLAKTHRSRVDVPWKDLPKKLQEVFLYGVPDSRIKVLFSHPTKGSWTESIVWKGVLQEARDRYTAAKSASYKKKMQEYMQEMTCPSCLGKRIKPYPAAAKLGGKNIAELTAISLHDLSLFLRDLPLTPLEQHIGGEIVESIIERLSFLQGVGLHYLSLERSSPTLSGGEGQRVRLASQIGASLVGATYILDEPSIGLHPRDNQKLLHTLLKLKDKGNTVLIVEHDEETIASCDEIIDIGPLAGSEGGNLVVQGSLEKVLSCKESLTGGYLSGRLSLPLSRKRKPDLAKQITLTGASHHNLQHLTCSLPLGLLIAVTGVSGSGKSSLVIDTLYPALCNKLHRADHPVGAYASLQGVEHLEKVIAVDQTPLGKTPRSNPATYIKLFDEIRDLFASLKESKRLGFQPGRFSFNVQEGCCLACHGMGMISVDMDFLEEEWEVCPTCQGKRFDDLTLSVRFKGKNIHDILTMRVADAYTFFQDQPRIAKKLDLLLRVGLGYIELGQSAPTLSGGEAQRVKLAKELARPTHGDTLYILDEPTTGLHFHDIRHLTEVLQSLVDRGNTVLVIEHNVDFIALTDFVIDLGPEAGADGGTLLFAGPPAALAKKKTPTGLALAHYLAKKKTMPMKAPEKTLPMTAITVKGARQNNLQSVSAEIPLEKITVCTGPSGSGKSSFAFDTLYAEGQRRYIESLSHYAQQFVKQLPKAKFEKIEGLPASLAIEQKSHAGNPRSTLGTMTEIYDFLRLLFCHLGVPHCPKTGEVLCHVSKEYVAEKILSLPVGTKICILAPVFPSKQETFSSFVDRMIKKGYVRIYINKSFFALEDPEIPWDSSRKNELFLVIDRLVLDPTSQARLLEGIEQALMISKDCVGFHTQEKEWLFHMAFTAPSTGESYPPIAPHTFSFNTEHGMCSECLGLGYQYGAQESFLLEFASKTPLDLLRLLCKEYFSPRVQSFFTKELASLGIDITTPLHRLPVELQRIFLEGSTDAKHGLVWKGLYPLFIQYAKTSSGNRHHILPFLLQKSPCTACGGSRLSPLARHVTIQGVSLADLCEYPLEKVRAFLSTCTFSEDKKHLTRDVLEPLHNKLDMLLGLGLGYLSLHRGSQTLSGGETQRVLLSKQLGSGLTGCLYVLDEPTVGLHPHDNHLLNQALLRLKELGNTLLLVEHDPMTMQIADYLLDFGPGAGKKGGHILAQGSLEEICQNPHSLTGAYLSGRKKIEVPKQRRSSSRKIELRGASLHNIRNLTLSLPLGLFCCVTGVSGAGKSTLLMEIIRGELHKVLSSKRKVLSTLCQGLEQIDKMIVLDQNPVGMTNRADVATYTEILTPLRYLYASLPEAKARGLQTRHFSYNHKKGMCMNCFGLGSKLVSLQFLPSVRVPCERCHGLRLQPLPLQVTYKGKNLGEILRLSVEQALDFFGAIPKLVKALEVLSQVGLGYLALGQEIATLSGGEAQRLRLSCELAKRSTGKTLYLLDEPSVGLHSKDLEKLIPIFHTLVDRGNSLFLIEHNLDLIAQADLIIDMGPGPGPNGGSVVCTGTPEEVALHATSKLSPFLSKHLTRK